MAYAKFHYLFILEAFLLLLLTSCSSMYLPNVPATPMFTNTGQGFLSAHINPKGNMSANTGIAITDHFAIIADGSYMDYKSPNYDFNQFLYEGGLGYFTQIGAAKRSILEFYIGYGIGSTKEIDKRASITGTDPVETKDMDFNKIFVQANFSAKRKNKLSLFGKKRNLTYGTAIRVSRIKMDRFELNYAPGPKEENLYIEPIFFTKLDLNKNFQLQYSSGWNVGILNNEYLKPGNAVFTLGIIYNFGKLK